MKSILRIAPLAILTLALSLTVACKKKAAEEAADAAPAPSTSAVAEAVDAAPPEDQKPVDVDRIPWQGEEEKKANKEISDQTYKAELDKIEGEIKAAK